MLVFSITTQVVFRHSRGLINLGLRHFAIISPCEMCTEAALLFEKERK